MSGEFAASEWRVAVLSVGLMSTYVVSTVLHALHSFLHLPCMLFRSGGVAAPLLFYQFIRCISIHKVYKVHPTPSYTCWDAGIASDRNRITDRIVISTFL